MINVEVFSLPDGQVQLNEFLKTAKLINENSIQIIGDNAYVQYEPELPVDELQAISISKRLRQTQEQLAEAEIHASYLKTVDIGDADKISTAMANNTREIKNFKALIEMYKTWEVLKS